MTFTYLITGATRGLGLALVQNYALQPDTVVVAATRDPKHASAVALTKLPTAKSSSVIVVKIESDSPTDAQAAVADLASQGITSLDVVIANAGIANTFPLVHEAEPKDMLEHYSVNVVGPVLLFKAVRSLLLEAAKTREPKFIAISSLVGTIAGMEMMPIPNAAYGTSKAALNFITRKMHFENPSITVVSLHPGWVQTAMGNQAALKLNLHNGVAPVTIDQSVKGMLSVISEATKEEHSGKFLDFEGEVVPW